MRNLNHIVIFSRPVQTGKTTELFKFIKGLNDVGGFLTPDVAGARMLYDIHNKVYHPFQTTASAAGETVAVGRFLFLASAFAIAQKILAASCTHTWTIVDEAGKLEIEQDAGFEPALTRLIQTFKMQKCPGKLLLVVRENLLSKAIVKYQLQDAQIVHAL